MSLFESLRAQQDADLFSDSPDIWIWPDGTRTVNRADDVIQVNVPLMRLQRPDWFDGEVFVLDSAGEFRYEPSGERWPTLRPGFTAYERVRS